MIVLRVSVPTFNEIALLLCSSGNHRYCKTKKMLTPHFNWKDADGQLIRVALPGLTLEPCRTIEQPKPVG